MWREFIRGRPAMGRFVMAAAIVAAGTVGFAALAAHEHGGGQGEQGQEGADGGKGGKGGHEGHGGKGGGMHGQAVPGAVEQKCHGMGDMPPHYCEPSYKVMSSVRGVRVSAVTPAGDTAVMMTLQELNAMAPGVGQGLVVVGGTGDLAGAAVVQPGWKQTTTVHLTFTGDGSIYSQGAMHIHVFPLTAP
jgi:hypothetical protein